MGSARFPGDAAAAAAASPPAAAAAAAAIRGGTGEGWRRLVWDGVGWKS